MTKADLIERIHKQRELATVPKRTIAEVVDFAFSEIARSLKKDDRFAYPGFGTFERVRRAARKGRNPQTGQPIPIPPHNTIAFRPAAALRDSVNGSTPRY